MWCESGLFKLAVLRDLTGFHRFRLSDLRTQGLSFFLFLFFLQAVLCYHQLVLGFTCVQAPSCDFSVPFLRSQQLSTPYVQMDRSVAPSGSRPWNLPVLLLVPWYNLSDRCYWLEPWGRMSSDTLFSLSLFQLCYTYSKFRRRKKYLFGWEFEEVG